MNCRTLELQKWNCHTLDLHSLSCTDVGSVELSWIAHNLEPTKCVPQLGPLDLTPTDNHNGTIVMWGSNTHTHVQTHYGIQRMRMRTPRHNYCTFHSLSYMYPSVYRVRVQSCTQNQKLIIILGCMGISLGSQCNVEGTSMRWWFVDTLEDIICIQGKACLYTALPGETNGNTVKYYMEH